jgi:acyl-CoA reductase-like NAD-dependent aldehyde dehydrogenase
VSAIEVVEPATEQVMAEVPRAGAEEVDAAVGRAKAAFPAWRAVAPADRAKLLRDLADALEARQEDLAQLEARNAGKPIGDARGEMEMVVETYRYYAGAPERLLGQTIPVAGGVDMTFREPLGVVGLIVPWNFPLTIASWKVAPALAAGNCVVLKPAELTPLTAIELEKIALAAGLPEGVLNVVAGPGSVCGRRLVEHPDVAKIAFTGSTEVGRGISSWAASRPTSSSPTPTLRRPPQRHRWRSSATPVRTAAPARGSWSSRAPSTTSSRRCSLRSSGSRSGIRSTTRPRWVR